jgi:hypothetical protein
VLWHVPNTVALVVSFVAESAAFVQTAIETLFRVSTQRQLACADNSDGKTLLQMLPTPMLQM